MQYTLNITLDTEEMTTTLIESVGATLTDNGATVQMVAAYPKGTKFDFSQVRGADTGKPVGGGGAYEGNGAVSRGEVLLMIQDAMENHSHSSGTTPHTHSTGS